MTIDRVAMKELLEKGSDRTILIVEDDPEVLEMLQLLFDADGHRTVAAPDGHKALELAAQLSGLDLIVADYNLPKNLNGLETIARLQEQAHPGDHPDRRYLDGQLA